jgi:hypothetical protein
VFISFHIKFLLPLLIDSSYPGSVAVNWTVAQVLSQIVDTKKQDHLHMTDLDLPNVLYKL